MIRGLPYDAELEYLESTGTQYIDTGVKKTSGTTIDCTFSLAATNTKAVFGGRTGAANSDRLALFAFNSNFRFDAGDQKYLYTPDTTSTFRFQYDGANAILTNLTTGVVDTQAVSIGEAGTVNIVLFGVSTNGEISAKLEGRIYSFKLWQSGVLALDLIPVRVGSGASAVGYMYDRVSKRLFGNAGSGAFVLGPDKAVPILSLHRYPSPSGGVALGKMGCTDLFHRITARDYVQSGLVSQWDSFDGYNQTSGHFFDLVNDTEVSDSKITRTQGGLMNYTGIGLVNLRTGLTPPEDFTFEMCLNVNNVEPVGSDRAEMMYAYGLTSLLRYSNDWFCNPTNAYVSYRCNHAPRFTVSFQIAGTSTNPNYPRAGSLFFAGAKTNDLSAAKNVTGTTLAVGRNTYTNMNVDIYSLRLYSRALTAAEIARNYAIDKARFGLP